MAGSVGFGLRCLTQLIPGTAPVAKGVLGSIEEALDDGVRGLIAMEQGGGSQAAGAAVVKELLKGRRDAVHTWAETTDDGVGAAAGGVGGGGPAVDPVAQGTQFLCRALLKGAERV